MTPPHFFLQLLEGNFALFITYALGHRNDYQNILLVIMVSVSIFHRRTLHLLIKALIRMRSRGHQEAAENLPWLSLWHRSSSQCLWGYSEAIHVGRCVALGLKRQIFRVRGGVVWAPGNLSPSLTVACR